MFMRETMTVEMVSMIDGMAMLPADQTKMRSHERHSMELTPDNPFFYQICRY